MARIVGSSFKAPVARPQGPQETAMDRALASFVSPAGVYLLAQGIGALGKLPFRSKEGGIDLAKEAASKRSAAIAQLKDAQLAQKQFKAGRTQKDVLEQRDRVSPATVDRGPVGQQEGETPAQFRERMTGKPERDDIDITEQRIIDMVAQAQKEGRPTTKADAAQLSEAMIRQKMEEELPTPEMIQADKLAELDDDQLKALANQIRKDNRAFQRASGMFQEKFGEQINPLIVQQNIDRSIEARVANREAINRELRKRQRDVEQRKDVAFLSERGQQLAGMTPSQQKQALRRMAREVKSEEDAAEVRGLLGRFAPARETIGDYFRSDDDIATEFEKEITDLIPKFDPLADLKRQELESTIALQRAQTAKTEAEGQAELADIGSRERVAMIQANAEADKARREDRNAASARSRQANARGLKEVRQRAKENARMIKDPRIRKIYLDATDKLIRNAKPGKIGDLFIAVNNVLTKNRQVNEALIAQEAQRKLDQKQAQLVNEALSRVIADERQKPQ